MKYKIKCVLFLFPRCKTATKIPMIRNIEGNRTETKTTLRSIKTDTKRKDYSNQILKIAIRVIH